MESTPADFSIDLAALVFTAAVLASYQLYLHLLARKDPAAVLSHAAAEARSSWVAGIMADPDSGLLAIQTLRNSTMAATFLASTAILLMVGVLTLSGQGPALRETWHALNMTGGLHPGIWLAKLLCMLVVLFFAFFSFSNAIRVFNHVGYMINVPRGTGLVKFDIALVSAELNRGGRFFSLGLRAYYYLIPLACWLFGPVYMLSAALLLVCFLLPWVDRVARIRP